MIEEIKNILNTLTDEAQIAALNKCKELPLSTDRGKITLEEAFKNFNNIRSIFMDMIEKERMFALPYDLQKILLDTLNQISIRQTSLANGTDEVVNLVNTIESLHLIVWQYGLYTLADEIWDYQKRSEKLKKLELEVERLNEELRKGLKVQSNLEKLFGTAQETISSIQQLQVTANDQTQKISDFLGQSTKSSQEASAKLTIIQQNEVTSAQHLANAQASATNIKAHETKIKEFFDEINKYREHIIAIEGKANGVVQTNEGETKKLLSELDELENKIKDQLQKATGYSLFHSFQKRKDDINNARMFWVKATGITILLTIAWSVWLSLSTENIDTVFYLKLTLSLPLAYAIGFCTLQYSHERRLEEEYAFKSNISVSLEAYRDLIEKIIEKNNLKGGEIEKYTAFMIDSINKIYTSPTEKVFAHKEKHVGLTDKTIKPLTAVLESLSQFFKSK